MVFEGNGLTLEIMQRLTPMEYYTPLTIAKGYACGTIIFISYYFSKSFHSSIYNNKKSIIHFEQNKINK
jgi:hypothetical protein